MRKLIVVILCLFLVGDTSWGAKGGSSSGSGRSYSSGSGSSGRSYSSGGSSSSRSSSSSSRSTPAPSRSYSSGSKPTPVSPSKSYSSGSGTKTTTPSLAPSKKPSTTYNSAGSTAQRKVESAAAYKKATTPSVSPPKTVSYKTPTGQTKTYDHKDHYIARLQTQLSAQKYQTRVARRDALYSRVPVTPIVTTSYNDHFNGMFWGFMLSQALDTRANTVYQYRDQMDPARYNQLLAQDAQLAARVRQLEAEKKQIDPNYVPPGVDSDLVYSDDFVKAVKDSQESGSSGGSSLGWTFLKVIGWICVVALGGFFLVVFITKVRAF